MNPRRSDKVRRAVELALQRWPEPHAPNPGAATAVAAGDDAVVRSMPRRRVVHTFDAAAVTLPMARRFPFRPGIIRPILRLFVWMRVLLYFLVGNAIDFSRRRDSSSRRAVRLRRLFETAGGSFGKLAQQLTIRADLLPYAYCIELSKLSDQAPAFPTAQAIAIVEQELGRPLADMFEIFDPLPIGSSSIACIYQATLRTGERVAVKVRRPSIERDLAADLRALDWLMILAEVLTIIRPGLTGRFRMELRKALMGELNFRREARYTEMFRLRAREYPEGITTRKVYFDYCSEQVLVSELVSGVWMWELMTAIDQRDEAFLARMATMGIEPKALASKLLRAVHHDVLEELFFHADPHPANIVVLPNNGICFIDFGAVGRFSITTRNAWRELHHHLRNEDIGRMANTLIALAGPLPPIDVDSFIKAMEAIFSDWVYALKSPHAEWWERSATTNWLRYVAVAREFGVPMALETIQFFRATVLYDSIVIRLDKNIDIGGEWRAYVAAAGHAARKRTRKQIRKRMGGLSNMDYLSIEKVFDTAHQLLFKVQRSVDDPIFHFRNIAGKISYAVALLLRLGYLAIFAGLVAVIADQISERLFGHDVDWSSVAGAILSSGWIQVALLIVAVVLVRRIILRVTDPDTRRRE